MSDRPEDYDAFVRVGLIKEHWERNELDFIEVFRMNGEKFDIVDSWDHGHNANEMREVARDLVRKRIKARFKDDHTQEF